MGEQYLYQKFPFLSQKKRSCLKYIFGLLLLLTTYRMPFTTDRMPLKVIVCKRQIKQCIEK